MHTRYPVHWGRANGERIAIEQMSQDELETALHLLEREDASDPIADALHAAIAQELLRRRAHVVALPARRFATAEDSQQRRAA